MRAALRAVRVGLLDMRGDLRRFVLLVACLVVGTALIAGVSSVGASIRMAVEQDAAQIMGADLELSRADRAATAAELATIGRFGSIADVIDTNVRAEADGLEGFVDLIAVGPAYPLLGAVPSPQIAAGSSTFDFLGQEADGSFGALVDPLMLDQLQIDIGDVVSIGGAQFIVRGHLLGVPDAAVRGFRLGLPVIISTQALATLGDRTSPLPGLGTFFRYKLLLSEGDAEEMKLEVAAALDDPAWTVLSARDGLGPMVRYYDLFMRFLVIVGLASLLIGGVSVWTSISAYIGERASVIAVLRSLGGTGSRIFIHFLTQIAALALVGVGIGVLIGAASALVALPAVGQAVGVNLPATVHVVPLLVAAGVGFVIAFAFSYLPLQQAQAITPVTLFRSKGLAAPPIEWRGFIGSSRIVPLIVAAALFFWLAVVMTGDVLLVAGFLGASLVSVLVFRLAQAAVSWIIRHLPEPRNHTLRHALLGLSSPGSNAASVVVSVGLALAMLVVVLVLQVNLRNEYLGASVFDAPTLVASDLFDDEVAALEEMRAEGDSGIAAFTATPMLRGALAQFNDTPVGQLRPRGPEASFLLSGEIPLTFRGVLPATSRVVDGTWWGPDYVGEPLVSLHESLRSGLGLAVGDRLTFSIFGEEVVAEIANFRDYSWQGGIDFLATFSPGVLDAYPTTLLGAVTAARGEEDAVERAVAQALPDVRFIAIGQTLELIAEALGQLSLAASLVGGLAVGNGLLVLLGALATGRRQRQADAVITRVLGARRIGVLLVAILQYGLLALIAALVATPLGIALAWGLTELLMDVAFTLDAGIIAAVEIGAVAITGLLGATTIIPALRSRSALFLRQLATE